jgi:hypothetical protein
MAQIAGAALRQASAVFVDAAATAASMDSDELGDRGRRAIEEWAATLTERPGRRGRSDDDYLDLAVAYVRLLDLGDPSPVKTLAQEWHLEPKSVSNLLHKARHSRGLLTPAPPGRRPGGSLTPKALSLLQRRHEEGRDDGQR